MSRPRFSLRGLLLLTFAVAGVCWYRDLPRQNAAKFVAAVNARDYLTARALISIRYREIKGIPALENYQSARVQSQNPFDWLAGRCYVHLSTNDPGWTMMMQATASGVAPRYLRQ
jgi:hypothetical protein